jgi:hypothetical protein
MWSRLPNFNADLISKATLACFIKEGMLSRGPQLEKIRIVLGQIAT